MSFAVSSNYNGQILIKYKIVQPNATFHSLILPLKNWKEIFSKKFDSTIKIKFMNSLNGPVNIQIKEPFEDALKIVRIKEVKGTDNFEFEGHVDLLNYMVFEIKLRDPPHLGLFESFKARLTEKGNSQLKLLESQLLKDSENVRRSDTFYAPFTSLVQSSGFGKSKLCVEMLRRYPGLYMVFRKQGESGIPKQTNWMKDVAEFILRGPKDIIPTEEEDLAVGYGPSRFLLVLEHLIKKYMEILNGKYNEVKAGNIDKSLTHLDIRNKAVEEVAKLTINDPEAVTSSNEFAIDVNELKNSTSKIRDVINNIYNYLNLNDLSNTSGDLMMNGSKSTFPFLLFLDEADHLNDLTGSGRVPGVNVIRRGLHLLNIKVRLLVVAIGTNSDVMDFIPLISDNSLRFPERKDLLPPFLISRNWDIYSNEFPYETIKVTKSVLRNNAMFKVLVSLGRPLWSSCPLNSVISLAEAKLKNGDPSKLSAVFALLMIRASHNVSSIHMLSRALVRSYMAKVRYVSTNGRSLVICYPSEPVLAMAARNLLKGMDARYRAFYTLKVFLQCRAIDKGRIVETIFEHLSLFAVDDADSIKTDEANSSAFPKNMKQLLECERHLLYLNRSENVNLPIQSNISISETYRIVKVRYFLIKLLGAKEFQEIGPFISERILEGYVNITHYINLKRLKKSDYKGLRGQIKNDDSGFTIIDRALLITGLLRQCGYVMPPGYYGIDFIVPVLLETESGAEPIYSFIGIQSKSSDCKINDILKKMNPSIHYVGSQEEREKIKILENSLVIVMQQKGKISNYRPSSYRVSSSEIDEAKSDAENMSHLMHRFGTGALSAASKSAAFKTVITKDHTKKEESAPPSSKKARIQFGNVEMDPKLTISKDVNSKLSVHLMAWNKEHSMTGIVIHDITAMGSLVDERTFELINDIVNYSTSPFDEVHKLHIGIVQDSVINGEFCEYPSLNPEIRTLRKMKALKFDLDLIHFKNYSMENVRDAIRSCGPENSTFSNLSSFNSDDYVSGYEA